MDLKTLSLKTALLLALASVKLVGDLQALSVSPACLEFGPNDSKVVLKPRHGYITKVLYTPFRAQVITLSALSPSTEDQELTSVLPHSGSRKNSLYALATKQRIYRWLVDAIVLAWSSLGLQSPIGVRAHSTRVVASSWAWSSGVSIAEICAVAGWASPSTFAKFYNLDVLALQALILSA